MTMTRDRSGRPAFLGALAIGATALAVAAGVL
jgi:hypothetical protein